MNKGILAVCIENMVTVICFTVLAVVFNKWWIVLFSVLLATSYKSKGSTR